ncbi:hypothetical protein [Acaryochloris sp. IP29b_bin.148]|uniref:hypothetical protein n=1 Tax=Acaryochloris sp. IP29b_bin.148 TaxID=2969218 RepID=UPI00260D88FB|nr:hypothetical protein [Acaryochloris sp. IP29b_bin.148]
MTPNTTPPKIGVCLVCCNKPVVFTFNPKQFLSQLGSVTLPRGAEEAVLCVFKTSLQKEEGDCLRPFCVLTERSHDQNSTKWIDPIRAETGLPKLSQLSCYGVRAIQLEMREDELTIVGITDVPRRQIHDKFMGVIWGSYLELDAMGIADIRACHVTRKSIRETVETPIARYQGGRYYTRNFEEKTEKVFSQNGGEVNRFLVELERLPGQPVPTSAGCYNYPYFSENLPISIFSEDVFHGRHAMHQVFTTAVSRLARRGRGGAAIVLDGSESIDNVKTIKPPELFEHRDRNGTEMPCTSVINWTAWQAIWQHLEQERRPIDQLPQESKDRKDYVKWIIERLSYQLNEYASMLCDMMIPDGALVLGKFLEPVAMGVKLEVSDVGDLSQEANDYLEKNMKGMRHRSMASAINCLPRSHGFVISNDGPVTLFRGREVEGKAVEVLKM